MIRVLILLVVLSAVAMAANMAVQRWHRDKGALWCEISPRLWS